MRIIRIEKCGECFHNIVILGMNMHWCGEAQKYFNDPETIPDWCPLEEVKDE